MRVYDNTEYEEQMFYFNTRTRVNCYTHPIDTKVIASFSFGVACCSHNVLLSL